MRNDGGTDITATATDRITAATATDRITAATATATTDHTTATEVITVATTVMEKLQLSVVQRNEWACKSLGLVYEVDDNDSAKWKWCYNFFFFMYVDSVTVLSTQLINKKKQFH